MKSVVPLWTWLAFGSVAAGSYVVADLAFSPSVAAPQVVALQETEPSPPPAPSEQTEARPMSAEEEAELLEGVEGFSPDAPDPDAIAEGDEAVDQILSELELIYEESDDNFIPTEPVSPDTTIDFPVDI